jgi:hypothetical protein
VGCGGEEMMINKTHVCKLCDNKVVYGYHFLGNTCGHKKELMNLESYNVWYWKNPNQVYRNGVLIHSTLYMPTPTK